MTTAALEALKLIQGRGWNVSNDEDQFDVEVKRWALAAIAAGAAIGDLPSAATLIRQTDGGVRAAMFHYVPLVTLFAVGFDEVAREHGFTTSGFLAPEFDGATGAPFIGDPDRALREWRPTREGVQLGAVFSYDEAPLRNDNHAHARRVTRAVFLRRVD